MPNRLAGEASPYLQQHADNPVDWWPWCNEAFEEARRRDVPVMLSSGYATCHWCHVMAHESFEDPRVAEALNEALVCIKLDREDRPDVDGLYMEACLAQNGSGGWPLTVFLTHERKPFFAGTYFPRKGGPGRPGILDVVAGVKAAWDDRRDEVVHAAGHMVDALSVSSETKEETIDAAVLARAEDALAGRYDQENGGFGGAPKFPSPHNLRFLLRRAVHAPDGGKSILPAVDHTLHAMRAGGIWDHLAGGFHRYSTDRAWLLPHFEKMLYDQAMHLMAYTEAYQVTQNEMYARVAREIVRYVHRGLRHPDGAFFAAEDADSDGREGAFYVWTQDELEAALGDKNQAVLAAWGVTPEGNFRDEATGRQTGENILHQPRPLKEVAAEHGMDLAELQERLSGARIVLLERRNRRTRPLRDEKVLADWNGLMITALARAGRVFAQRAWLDHAARAARFVLDACRGTDGLCHRWMDGRRSSEGFLEDHAFMALAALELFDATQERSWLDEAMRLASDMEDRFRDPPGAYFQTSAKDALWKRRRETTDGAIPCGNSVAVEVLWRLGRLTDDEQWRQATSDAFAALAPAAKAMPGAHTALLSVTQAALADPVEVVIAGPAEDRETQGLLAAARAGLHPERLVLVIEPGEPPPFPWMEGMGPIDGKPAAYVCRDHACEQPVTTMEALCDLLAQ